MNTECCCCCCCVLLCCFCCSAGWPNLFPWFIESDPSILFLFHSRTIFFLMYPLAVLCRLYSLDLPTSSVITGMRGAKAGVSPPRQSRRSSNNNGAMHGQWRQNYLYMYDTGPSITWPILDRIFKPHLVRTALLKVPGRRQLRLRWKKYFVRIIYAQRTTCRR